MLRLKIIFCQSQVFSPPSEKSHCIGRMLGKSVNQDGEVYGDERRGRNEAENILAN